MKVQVHVTLKPGVLDPQGKAIHHALEGLGFAGVADVRAGRFFELEVADDVTDADLDAMSAKLLANTVIENYRITYVSTTRPKELNHEDRGHRLSRLQLRPRNGGRAREHHRHRPGAGP